MEESRKLNLEKLTKNADNTVKSSYQQVKLFNSIWTKIQQISH